MKAAARRGFRADFKRPRSRLRLRVEARRHGAADAFEGGEYNGAFARTRRGAFELDLKRPEVGNRRQTGPIAGAAESARMTRTGRILGQAFESLRAQCSSPQHATATYVAGAPLSSFSGIPTSSRPAGPICEAECVPDEQNSSQPHCFRRSRVATSRRPYRCQVAMCAACAGP